MTVYSYSQLEGLWINAGGSKALAPLMAAIAEAESGGNSDAENPSGASGLWQILGQPFPGNVFDPATNARMAVDKYKTQGLGAWTTYTSGAYKAYLSNSTTPDTTVPGSPSAASTQALTAGQSDCLVGNPLTVSVGPLSASAGPACLFSKSNARAWLGAGILLAGGAIALAGVAVLVAGVGLKAAGPLGTAAEGVGGALLLVPGAEGAGAAIAAAGSGAKRASRNPGAEAGRRRSAGAREDAARERALGQPRENPDMEVRAGAVRESGGDRAARRRRETGAARARARRAAGGGRPATRDEAGF